MPEQKANSKKEEPIKITPAKLKKIERALGGLSPARRIFLSFAGVIFIGSLLLSLPFVQANGSQATYLTIFLRRCSMVCVTGLLRNQWLLPIIVWGAV